MGRAIKPHNLTPISKGGIAHITELDLVINDETVLRRGREVEG
jgi:hypothetical protein